MPNTVRSDDGLVRFMLPFGLTHLETDPVRPRVYISNVDFWLYAGVGVVKSTADGVTGIITRSVVGHRLLTANPASKLTVPEKV